MIISASPMLPQSKHTLSCVPILLVGSHLLLPPSNVFWDALVFDQNSFYYKFSFAGFRGYPDAWADMLVVAGNPQGAGRVAWGQKSGSFTPLGARTSESSHFERRECCCCCMIRLWGGSLECFIVHWAERRKDWLRLIGAITRRLNASQCQSPPSFEYWITEFSEEP